MFWHPKLKLCLLVYADDFKMAGPKAHIGKGWDLIRKGLLLEAPTPMGNCLGCKHIITDETVDDKPHRRCTWEMEKFLGIAVVT